MPPDLGVVLWGSGFALAMSPILSKLAIALLGGPSAWRGGSWLGYQDLPATHVDTHAHVSEFRVLVDRSIA